MTKTNRLHHNLGNEIQLAGSLTIRDNFMASSIVKGQLPYRGLGSDVLWALEKLLKIVTREQKGYWLIKKAYRKPATGLNLAVGSSKISLGKNGENPGKLLEKIVPARSSDGHLNIAVLSTMISIERNIQRLQKQGCLHLFGPDKSEYYKVIG